MRKAAFASIAPVPRRQERRCESQARARATAASARQSTVPRVWRIRAARSRDLSEVAPSSRAITPRRSSSLRFWPSLNFPSSRSTASSKPTIAWSFVAASSSGRRLGLQAPSHRPSNDLGQVVQLRGHDLAIVLHPNLSGGVNHGVVPGRDRERSRIPGGGDVGVRTMEDGGRRSAVERPPVGVRARDVSDEHDRDRRADARATAGATRRGRRRPGSRPSRTGTARRSPAACRDPSPRKTTGCTSGRPYVVARPRVMAILPERTSSTIS